MPQQQGTRAKDLFAALRNEVPEFVQAERDLGSRLVVAKNVMRLRIQRGYTQRRLADELGVTQPRVAEIEGARANLKLDTLDRLARVLGVETSSLFKVEKKRVRGPAGVREQTPSSQLNPVSDA
jgi:DNA-binding XRE family transcriptional regulator